jgi:hypothetical protein
METDKIIDRMDLSDDDRNNKMNVFSKNTYIYGWGRNKYGELGLGNTNDTYQPW